MNSYNLIHTSQSYIPVTVINRGGPSCLLFVKIIHFCTYVLVNSWLIRMNSYTLICTLCLCPSYNYKWGGPSCLLFFKS